MKIPKVIDKYMPRIMIYGGLLGAGAIGGLEDLISATKVIALLEVGVQACQWGQRKGYYPYIKYEYKENNEG